MIIVCPSCSTRFAVNAAAFPAAGRKVKCARCAHVWHALPEAAETPAPARPAASAAASPAAAPATATAAAPSAPHAAAVPPPRPSRADASPEMIWAGSDLPPRRKTGGAAWAGIVAAAVTFTAFGLVQFRDSIVGMMPALASAYRAVGLDVDTVGLDIKIEAHAMNDSGANGATTLVVTGSVANVTSQERPVPPIRATLLDKDKRELHSWTFDSGIGSLKPGETRDFQQVLAQPPAETYQVYAHFADAGE